MRQRRCCFVKYRILRKQKVRLSAGKTGLNPAHRQQTMNSRMDMTHGMTYQQLVCYSCCRILQNPSFVGLRCCFGRSLQSRQMTFLQRYSKRAKTILRWKKPDLGIIGIGSEASRDCCFERALCEELADSGERSVANLERSAT